MSFSPIQWISGLGRYSRAKAVRPLESDEERPQNKSAVPDFDVTAAYAECRYKPGYISFGDIQGLGAPPDTPKRRDKA
ncbi:hypothetical protein R3P38DRAFT_3184916 [Favolaschia claudopus]|uniref:Uncharacterized protein n=1 Tax=Favolaschia claudopus TaxID=2862362 RepID=A0AAW0C8V7_9AGAR